MPRSGTLSAGGDKGMRDTGHFVEHVVGHLLERRGSEASVFVERSVDVDDEESAASSQLVGVVFDSDKVGLSTVTVCSRVPTVLDDQSIQIRNTEAGGLRSARRRLAGRRMTKAVGVFVPRPWAGSPPGCRPAAMSPSVTCSGLGTCRFPLCEGIRHENRARSGDPGARVVPNYSHGTNRNHDNIRSS